MKLRNFQITNQNSLLSVDRMNPVQILHASCACIHVEDTGIRVVFLKETISLFSELVRCVPTRLRPTESNWIMI